MAFLRFDMVLQLGGLGLCSLGITSRRTLVEIMTPGKDIEVHVGVVPAWCYRGACFELVRAISGAIYMSVCSKLSCSSGLEVWRLVDDYLYVRKRCPKILAASPLVMTVKPCDFGSAFGFWFSWAGLSGRSGL